MADKIKITFLGTADAIPSASRNHPAFLISYKAENILVDCGEGTQRQFRKAGINPGKVTKLLITHWHGDHVLGIPGLLQTLAFGDYKKTLEVYGPKNTKKYMNEILKTFVFSGEIKMKVFELEKEGKFFESEDFYLEFAHMKHKTPCNSYNFVVNGKVRIDKKKLEKLGISSGPHLKDLKIGNDIKFKGKKYKAKNLIYAEKGKKVSFVLDTAMNDKISKFVYDSDLLVIESTYDAESAELAREHNHMTSKQAGEVAKKAKVSKLALVHLSQRYDRDKNKILKEAKGVFKKETFVPKDLDVILV